MEKMNKEIKRQKLRDPIELFESSVSPWWKNIKTFLLIYFQALKKSLFAILALLFLYFFQDKIDPNNLLINWAYLALGIFSYLIILYYFMRAQMTTFLFIKSDYKGDVAKLFKSSAKLFFPYLWLNIIMSILVIAGTLAFVIPGIIISVIYGFAIYVFFCEDKKGLKALRRSKELVDGYFWPVFGRMMFVALIAFSFAMIISLPQIALEKGSALFNFWTVLTQLLSLAVAPAFTIYSYKIYKSLVEFKAKEVKN